VHSKRNALCFPRSLNSHRNIDNQKYLSGHCITVHVRSTMSENIGKSVNGKFMKKARPVQKKVLL
jgi:hypothetical protein